MNLLKSLGIAAKEKPLVYPYSSNSFAKWPKTFDFFSHKKFGRFVNGETKTFSTAFTPQSASSYVFQKPPS